MSDLQVLIEEYESLKLNRLNYDPIEYKKLKSKYRWKIYNLRYPEKRKESQRKFDKSEKKKKYRLKKRKKWNMLARKKYKNNKQKESDRKKLARDTNHFHYRRHVIKQEEKKHGIKTVVTENDLQEILNSFGNRCFRCSTTEMLCFDHFYPIRYGIPLSKHNCTVLCKSCNTSKGVKYPKEFFTEEEMDILERDFGLVNMIIYRAMTGEVVWKG